MTEKKTTLTAVAATATLAVLSHFVEIPGTYSYPINRVIDGDTIEIEAPFLPKELNQKLNLRVLGIDTPEKGILAKCKLEDLKSIAAKQFVEETLSKAKDVKIHLKRWDKYGGRVLGDLEIDGKYLSKLMIETGHAVEYHGEKKSTDWCKKK